MTDGRELRTRPRGSVLPMLFMSLTARAWACWPRTEYAFKACLLSSKREKPDDATPANDEASRRLGHEAFAREFQGHESPLVCLCDMQYQTDTNMKGAQCKCEEMHRKYELLGTSHRRSSQASG